MRRIRPTTRLSLWVAALMTLALLAIVLLLQIPVLSIPILLAVGLAYVLEPLLIKLESRGYSRSFGISLMGLGFLGLFAGAILVLPSWLSEQVAAFRTYYDPGMARIHGLVADAERTISEGLPFLGTIDLVGALAERSAALRDGILERAPGAIAQTVIGTLLVPLFTFFLLRDSRRAQKGLLEMVPNRHFEMTLSIFYRMDQQVGAYLRGVLLEASIVGLMAFGALTLISNITGLGAALPLSGAALVGAVVGITNLIPYFGPVAGGVTGLVYVAFTSPDPMLAAALAAVIGAVVIAQLTDNILIGPLVLGKAVDVHPLLVVLLLLVFGRLFGLMGLVVAVPLWAVFRVVVQETIAAIRAYGRYMVDVS